MSRLLFISCVTGEFEHRDGRYSGFRTLLAAYLRRADCVVKVQEDFRQAAELDTVEKLAAYIRDCKAVVHLLGQAPGSVANKDAHKAFLALHYGVKLFIYAIDDAATAQATHLSRLRTARKFADTIKSDVDLLGKLIGDLREILSAEMPHSLQGPSGVEQAFAPLAEAEQIATRGPMPLYLADIHLTRARIAITPPEPYGVSRRFRSNSISAVQDRNASAFPLMNFDLKAELTKARRLIEKHNYGRRIEELEDAEAALL